MKRIYFCCPLEAASNDMSISMKVWGEWTVIWGELIHMVEVARTKSHILYRTVSGCSLLDTDREISIMVRQHNMGFVFRRTGSVKVVPAVSYLSRVQIVLIVRIV